MKQPATLFAVLSAIAMIAAVVIGLIVIGSPNDFRMRRFDDRRANDLASISAAVRTYRFTHEGLPQKLDDLEPAITYSLKDPVGRPYEYAIKDEFSYELCAEFNTATDTLTAARFRSVFEKHGSARQCFTQEARPPARR
jgi:hypothetical protein